MMFGGRSAAAASHALRETRNTLGKIHVNLIVANKAVGILINGQSHEGGLLVMGDCW